MVRYNLLRDCLLMMILILAAPAWADLTVEITRGNDDATPIAIVPFGGKFDSALVDIAHIMAQNFRRSGRFAPMPPKNMLSLPNITSDITYAEWNLLRVEYIVVGSVLVESGLLRLRYALHSVSRREVLHEGEFYAKPSELRQAAHRISDDLYFELTGARGSFATKIAYVVKQIEDLSYALHMADADGGRDQILFNSKKPILSPSFSPLGDELAYVGFESGEPTIYRYIFKTKKIIPLLSNLEYSSAPAWSVDGKYLAMTLARDGNIDVYTYNLRRKTFKRITKHFAIDTEPTFSHNGKWLLFTSDRSGGPQIYRLAIGVKDAKPILLTKQGGYNARAVPLPDGNGMLLVHGNKGNYHIARFLFAKETFNLLSDTKLDESPTLSPNGHMLMYGSNHEGRSVMMVVSVPNGAASRLQSSLGEIGDPTWSSYLY